VTTGYDPRSAKTRCDSDASWPNSCRRSRRSTGLVALMEIQASRSSARVGSSGEPILFLLRRASGPAGLHQKSGTRRNHFPMALITEKALCRKTTSFKGRRDRRPPTTIKINIHPLMIGIAIPKKAKGRKLNATRRKHSGWSILATNCLNSCARSTASQHQSSSRRSGDGFDRMGDGFSNRRVRRMREFGKFSPPIRSHRFCPSAGLRGLRDARSDVGPRLSA